MDPRQRPLKGLTKAFSSQKIRSPSNWRKHQYKLSRKAALAVGTASLTTLGAGSQGGPEGL